MGEDDEMQQIENLERRQILSDQRVVAVFKIVLVIVLLGLIAFGLQGCDGIKPRCFPADTNNDCNVFRDIIAPNAWRFFA